jgi:flagellar hook-associated protein 1 FlgK
MGGKAATLAVVPDPFDVQNRQILSFLSGGISSNIENASLTGGEIKGLQDFINNDLTGAQAQLGRMAFVMANEINTQQTLGLNLTGTAGQNMFSVASPVVSAAANNTGTAVLSLSLASDKALAGSDYEVTYNTPTTVTVRRLADGVVVAGTPAPTTLPLTVDGLTLANVSGVAVTGDRFLLRPVADAAKNIAVVIAAPKDLAVSSAVALTPGISNSKGITIEQATKISATAGALPISIAFNATGQISFNGGGGPFVAFTPGQAMTNNGYSITLRGTPANGDTFSLAAMPAAAARYNSGNAQEILKLRDQVMFDNSTTLSDGYVTVFSSVASSLREAKFSAEFSSAQAASAETQRANKAGVNLDEEAALLIQYQQAYQASAKYMGAVQSLFDTLMSAFR